MHFIVLDSDGSTVPTFSASFRLPTSTMFIRHRRTSSLHQVQDGQCFHYRARDSSSSMFAGALRCVAIVGGQQDSNNTSSSPLGAASTNSAHNHAAAVATAANGNAGAGDDRCSICLGRFFTNNDPVTKIQSCGHHFHDTCIRNWLQQPALTPSCPTCRADVPMLPKPTSPSGTMTIQLGADVCPGYDPNTTTLEIIYSVPTGLQHSVRHNCTFSSRAGRDGSNRFFLASALFSTTTTPTRDIQERRAARTFPTTTMAGSSSSD
jgi:Ring finger domain